MPINDGWKLLSPVEVNMVPDRAGVYELADGDWKVIYIGMAGAGSLMKRVSRHINDPQNPCIRARVEYFRYEVNPNPTIRAEELLREYRRNHGGRNPPCNP